MAKVLVAYYSQTGHTRSMAELVAQGAESAGAKVTIKDIQQVSAKDLLEYDGIILGSPTYYGLMVAPIKELADHAGSRDGDSGLGDGRSLWAGGDQRSGRTGEKAMSGVGETRGGAGDQVVWVKKKVSVRKEKNKSQKLKCKR
jgi:multimeric flavodoxin WrbA